MLQKHDNLGRVQNKILPVTESLQENFPNLVKLLTEVTDLVKCRELLGDARRLMYQAVPEAATDLFFPVLEIIQKSIK